jgi:hypothetical protein
LRKILNFVVEVVENSIILFTAVGFVERLDVSTGLLLDPGIGVGNVTD